MNGYKQFRIALLTLILLLLCASTALASVFLAYPKRVGLGEPFLVRVTSDTPLESVSIKWKGKSVKPEIRTWKGRSVALAMFGTDVLSDKIGRDKLVIKTVSESKERTFGRTVKVNKKKYRIQRLTLPEKMVTPPAEVLDKIAQDRREVAVAKAAMSPERKWYVPFTRPTKGSQSSPYGAQRILNGKPKNPHRGLDFRGAKGNAIKAMADGKVVLVGNHYYAGNSVYIDHGSGVVTMYFHLSRIDVKEGELVERGQLIGGIGSTGRVTGPHLHMSVSVQGKLVDPSYVLYKTTDQLLGIK
ncbi:M23 family metallopeptidase [Maridesulfovibrio salexigens]|uniref:Peptidase M23 n=1 Tax=Maridesulfovibrio salexigens (strain ATCC 14822 / DSM 2638 / NCIMB 8403 / VKM B-1763) TaxID=526222 RepID=C6BYX9_MARSD|nr:M23 family metallopeptidase [Maridesulfovibrio salexigens]ACS78803.1 Peptidase M23 [Maridesulfovibrio salexigens DSM 2638]